MRSMKHMAAVHKAAARHFHAEATDHEQLSKHHLALHKHYTAMHKESGEDLHKGIATEHDGLHKVHAAAGERNTQHAAEHETFSEACMKAHSDAMNKLQRDDFTSVIPSDTPGFGIRSVARHGSPDLGIDKASVPAQFQHLLNVEDEV